MPEGTTGILVGSARVSVLPDMRGWLTTVQAEIKSALKSVDATVPVKVELDKASVARAQAALGPLAAGRAVPLRFNVDAASVARARAAMGPLAGERVPVKFDLDKASLARAQAAARDAIGLMPEGRIPLDFDLNASSLAKAMAQFRTATGLLAGGKLPLYAEFSYPSLVRAQAAFRSAVGLTHGGAIPLSVDLNQASLARAQAQLRAVTGPDRTIPVNFAVNTAPLLAAAAAVRTLNAAVGARRGGLVTDAAAARAVTTLTAADRATRTLTADTNQGARAAAGAYRPWFGLWGLLGRRVTLFGGAFGTTAIVGAVGAVHLLIDVVAEFLAVVVPASVALAAFGLGAAPTVRAIVQQMQRLQTVTDAYGTVLPGVTGGLHKLAAAVKPEVYSLFGDALTIVNSKTDELTHLARGAGAVLDKLGARFTLAITGSNTFSRILAGGAADLAKLGDIVGNLGGVLGNVLSVLPGYATALLNIADAGSKMLEWASHAAEPLIGFGLAAHGAILYGGLLATGLVSLGRRATTSGTALNRIGQFIGLIPAPAQRAYGSVERLESGVFQAGRSADVAGSRTNLLKNSLAALQKVPVWGWVAVGVAALGGLVYWLATARDKSQQWYAATEANILGQKTFQGVTTATARAVSEANRTLAETPKVAGAAGILMGRAAGALGRQSAAYVGARNNSRAFTGQLTLEEVRVAQLQRKYGDMGNALGLFNKLGIRASDIAGASAAAWQRDIFVIDSYLKAITALSGFQGGRALAAQKALTFSTNQQFAAIQQITQAQDIFINRMVAGETTFDQFALGQKTLAANMRSTSNAGKSVSFTLGHLSSSAKVAGATMGGLSQGSLSVNQAYYAQVVAGQQLIDSLQQQFISQNKLRTAVASVARNLIPYAGNNKAARVAVVGLINNALGPGTVSLRTLNHWVGQNSTTMRGFKAIVDQSEVAASQLAKGLQNDLNVQFRQDLLAASGASGALKTYTADLVHNRAQTQQGKIDRARLITDLENAGLSAKQAAAYVANLARQVGGLHGKKITITEYGSGSFSISEGGHVVAHGVGHNIAPAGQRTGITGASGAFVAAGTTPTADDVLARVSKGELIVPAKMVSAGLVDHLRGMIPGFQAGGVAGADLPAMTKTFDQAMTTVMTKSMLAAMNAALRSAERAAAAAAFSSLHGIPGGGGTARWTGLVRQALAMEGLSPFLAGNVLYQMQTESGGNARAINLTDINAQQGDPSRGLMQTIMSTFRAYHWPGTSWNIYDPLANIAAALNYARHRYGPTLQSGGMGIGSGHGYDAGGWLPPGLSLAANMTGKPELVLNASQLARLAGNGERTVNYNISAPGASLSDVRAAIAAAEVRSATLARIGRRS